MRRFVRIMAIVLLLLATALLASSVGVVMPWSFRVAGPDGAPAKAWVVFAHEGNHVHFAESLDWRRPGGILKSDASGIVQLPLVIYLKPPLDDWVRHKVQTIFVPALHATVHEHRADDGAVLTIPDNTGNPNAWDHALGEIYSLVAHDMAPGEHKRYKVAPDMARTLARMVGDDYHALLAAHGGKPRTIPEDIPGHFQFASEEDRAEWREQMRLEIEDEPTWGAYLERRYAKRIAELQEMFGL
jgi:hypothetical protein